MKKYFFSYIAKPKIKDFREETCLDKLYEIEDVYKKETLEDFSEITRKKLLISDAIKNYKNCILMAKVQYAIANNYYKLLKNENEDTQEYQVHEFLARMYFEDVITKLFSSYDKTYHILNSLYDLKVNPNKEKENFRNLARLEIKKIDKKTYNKLKSIAFKLSEHDFSKYRDDIIHNKSLSFTRFNKDYNLNYLNINVDRAIKMTDIFKGIEELSNIIYEQVLLIKDRIKNIL